MATATNNSQFNITLQYSIAIARIHVLGRWLPFNRVHLRSWTNGGKVQTMKSKFIEKALAFHFSSKYLVAFFYTRKP